ncbi:hypothetical protein M8542_47370 [Amycolatopsis sp. OK19-0408]|uniref:Uncharacterized protein n=1 Tax=Amycolatopsis iheyensis TaxID=2945988 RepID=A0A9X2SRF4_9PSEU|nr:hypothetical protein [Amycolatopsis iheyensis]MCR6490451.1 hypothetical protein [Amycolatopsis iheyensis]
MENTTAVTRSAAPAVLWPLLVVSAGVNAVGSFTGMADPFRITAGAIATVALILLVVHYVRRRRQ